MPSLASPTFWRDVAPLEGTLQSDGPLDYMVLPHSTAMRVIMRSAATPMTDVVKTTAGMKVVVNGNMFDAGYFTRGAAAAGNADDPSSTTPLGRLVDKGGVIGGISEPGMFYFAQIMLPAAKRGSAGPLSFVAGFGDPPTGPDLRAAVGGVGPLIIGGLSYGSGNIYKPGAPGSPPSSGAPPAADMPFLTQRNNNTFSSAEGRSPATGKTILASSFATRKLIVIVQPDGAAGMSYASIRDNLLKLWVDQAVFLDGSDSVFMYTGGRFIAAPGTYKNDLDTVAIGFT
jgi:hypothetical protein